MPPKCRPPPCGCISFIFLLLQTLIQRRSLDTSDSDFSSHSTLQGVYKVLVQDIYAEMIVSNWASYIIIWIIIIWIVFGWFIKAGVRPAAWAHLWTRQWVCVVNCCFWKARMNFKAHLSSYCLWEVLHPTVTQHSHVIIFWVNVTEPSWHFMFWFLLLG